MYTYVSAQSRFIPRPDDLQVRRRWPLADVLLFFIFGRRAVCIRALEPREIPSIFSLSQFSTPAGGLHKSSCSRRIRGAARGDEGWIE